MKSSREERQFDPAYLNQPLEIPMSAQHMNTLAQQFRAASEANEKFIFPLMTSRQWAQFEALLGD